MASSFESLILHKGKQGACTFPFRILEASKYSNDQPTLSMKNIQAERKRTAVHWPQSDVNVRKTCERVTSTAAGNECIYQSICPVP